MMKHRVLNLRNILLLVGIFGLATWYAILLTYMLTSYRGPKRGVDYLNHYSAGYIIRYESPGRLYDLDLQRHIQESVASSDRVTRYYYYNHPPLLAGILGWVTTKDYNASYFRWVLVLIVFHLTSLSLLLYLMRRFQWQMEEIWVLGISGLLFAPLFVAYLKGQDSTFLLLGVSLWTFGLLTARDRVAGLGLALALIRPQIALVLALPFLFKRRIVWWWFIAWSLILLVYCYLLVGVQGLEGFAQVLLFSGQGTGIDVDKMVTLMGAILRLFPDIDPRLFQIIGYGGYGLSILFLCLLWARSRAIELQHIGLAILFSMAFSPHMHNHGLSLLLIPALAAATTLAINQVWSRRYAVLLPLGASLILTVNDISYIYTVIYLLMLALALFLWFPGWFKPRKKEPRVC
ncbi:MAG: glycosyltransferase family 87 protein [Anaerolineales bacterium]|nr:glycosyltransferase family 87 protein [Anaerolineales bacterium]